MRHEPTLYATGRHGCWACCTCGRWQSRRYTTVSGAHYAYGRHLLANTTPLTRDGKPRRIGHALETK